MSKQDGWPRNVRIRDIPVIQDDTPQAMDDWAKRPSFDDPLDSTYSSLLVISLIVAVIFMGLIIAWVWFGE